jgi:GGDEF domain-containing protein
MLSRPPRRRRARPVADAPIDELLSRADELTKGWLLELLEQAELEDAAAIAASPLTREGPRICAAVVQALADDHDLRRLEPGGVLEPLVAGCAEFGGGAGPLVVVDALHGVVWSALRGELRDADPDQVYELAERLTAVTELVRAAALRRAASFGSEAAAEPAVEQPREEVVPPAPRASVRDEPRLQAVPDTAPGAALWVEALDEEVARSRRTGAPLALLLVALEDGERLAAAEPEPDVTAAFGRFAQAVRSVLRRQDLLASENETRVWVIARDTGRSGAIALAERVDRAVRGADSLRGVPLTVNMGLAVLGEDGGDAAALLEAAEESCFAAAASGSAVGESAGESDPDAPAGPASAG